MSNTRFVALAMVLVLPACGGGGSPAGPSATPPTTMPSPAASRITLGVENAYLTVTSTQRIGRLTLTCGNLDADFVFVESAGLAATIVKSDVYVLEADGDITGRSVQDRQDAIPAAGRLSGSITQRFECGYEGKDLPYRLKGAFNITDAKGNRFTLTVDKSFAKR